VAVRRFLAGELAFGAIVPLLEAAVERFGGTGSADASGEPGLDELIALDSEVRDWVTAARPETVA
jgi:1-deoxy-D-xylulose 5-phosphate reductoisomerase